MSSTVSPPLHENPAHADPLGEEPPESSEYEVLYEKVGRDTVGGRLWTRVDPRNKRRVEREERYHETDGDLLGLIRAKLPAVFWFWFIFVLGGE